jgi:hypothetical protein
MSEIARTKKLKARTNDAGALIKVALAAAKIHMKLLLSKAKAGTMTTQESITLCSYLKTFTYFEKTQREGQKDYAKIVNKMSDEEIEEALEEHSAEILKLSDFGDKKNE